MIEFSLSCDQGHSFDAWFPNNASFEEQQERKLVTCPMCGSLEVKKALMTPHIGNNAGRNRGGSDAVEPGMPMEPPASAPAPAPSSVPQAAVAPPAPPTPEQIAKMEAMMVAMRQVQEHAKKNFDDVGSEFPEEARKMHYGEKDPKGIFGQASGEEIEELIDEGIDIIPLPKLPELDS